MYYTDLDIIKNITGEFFSWFFETLWQLRWHCPLTEVYLAVVMRYLIESVQRNGGSS
jgi:hypothetical protein